MLILNNFKLLNLQCIRLTYSFPILQGKEIIEFFIEELKKEGITRLDAYCNRV